MSEQLKELMPVAETLAVLENLALAQMLALKQMNVHDHEASYKQLCCDWFAVKSAMEYIKRGIQ